MSKRARDEKPEEKEQSAQDERIFLKPKVPKTSNVKNIYNIVLPNNVNKNTLKETCDDAIKIFIESLDLAEAALMEQYEYLYSLILTAPWPSDYNNTLDNTCLTALSRVAEETTRRRDELALDWKEDMSESQNE